MEVIQIKVLEKPKNWAIREGGMSLNLSPASRPSYAKMSDYDGTEAGGSESITRIGRTAPKLDLC